MTTQNWNFDERDNSTPIEYDGGANEICKGCTVELEQDGTRVTVAVQGNEGNWWTGEITSLGAGDNEVGELKIGTTIKFEETNIFRCAA